MTSVAADPSAAGPRIELARYHLSFLRIDEAMAELRMGLGWSPDNPVLLGLWGYAARSAALRPGEEELAGDLVGGLEAYRGKSADGWYWLAQALAASGRDARARAALGQAQRLAPEFGRAAYEARLRGVL